MSPSVNDTTTGLFVFPNLAHAGSPLESMLPRLNSDDNLSSFSYELMSLFLVLSAEVYVLLAPILTNPKFKDPSTFLLSVLFFMAVLLVAVIY
jgi:hypothetical protein